MFVLICMYNLYTYIAWMDCLHEKDLPDLHKALEFEFSSQVLDLSAIFKSLHKKDEFILKKIN